MTTAMTKASGIIQVHPKNASQMISSRLWIIPHEARSQRRRRSSRSSCRRNAHGIQVPIMWQSIVTTFEEHLATPVVAKRTRSQWTKILKMTTKGNKGARQSSRMLQRPSTSSSGETETSAPGGTRNCFSGRSCPSSWWYHDHFVGQRSPSRSPAMTSGQASQSPVSSPWSWIQWWQKSGSPRCSLTVGVVSISSSLAL
jgi:hypothetical protein